MVDINTVKIGDVLRWKHYHPIDNVNMEVVVAEVFDDHIIAKPTDPHLADMSLWFDNKFNSDDLYWR